MAEWQSGGEVMSETLFPVDEMRKSGGDKPKCGMPRVLRPNRAQVELRPTGLESLLPEDHRARAIWEFVSELALSPWYDAIEAVEG